MFGEWGLCDEARSNCRWDQEKCGATGDNPHAAGLDGGGYMYVPTRKRRGNSDAPASARSAGAEVNPGSHVFPSYYGFVTF